MVTRGAPLSYLVQLGGQHADRFLEVLLEEQLHELRVEFVSGEEHLPHPAVGVSHPLVCPLQYNLQRCPPHHLAQFHLRRVDLNLPLL